MNETDAYYYYYYYYKMGEMVIVIILEVSNLGSRQTVCAAGKLANLRH